MYLIETTNHVLNTLSHTGVIPLPTSYPPCLTILESLTSTLSTVLRWDGTCYTAEVKEPHTHFLLDCDNTAYTPLEVCGTPDKHHTQSTFLSPGEEMHLRSVHNFGFNARLTEEDIFKFGNRNLPNYIEGDDLGHDAQRGTQYTIKVETCISTPFELKLRKEFVFPPWRLYSSRPLSDDEIFNAPHPHNMFHRTVYENRNYLVQPTPISRCVDTPSYAHPELIISHNHEFIIKDAARKAHCFFRQDQRLYLGKPASTKEKVEAIKNGYLVVQLQDQVYRVIYPPPTVMKDQTSVSIEDTPSIDVDEVDDEMREIVTNRQSSVVRKLDF
jgi:hypothetical protein